MAANAQTTSLRYRVQGIDCASCAIKIETAVRRIDGVREVAVSATAATMRVDARTDGPPVAEIERQVRQLGYGLAAVDAPTPAGAARAAVNGRDDHATAQAHGGAADTGGHSPGDGHGHSHFEDDGPLWASQKARLTMACAAAVAVAFLASWLFPSAATVLYTIAMAVGLVPIAMRAYSAARAGTPFSIETLMTIAAVGAVFIGASEEAAFVVLLFLVGELLEGYAAARARASIRSLTDLMPKAARVERGGTIVEVEAATLMVGDVLVVRPGDRIAADGEILAGESTIDEAPVTGESTPKAKGKGDAVFAGTINADGTLRVTVTATGEDNTIARVVKLVEEAQESKAPTERFIDRFSTYYTPAVLLAGFLVAVAPPLLFGAEWGGWIYKGLAVLLIGCPCALVISTPAAIAAGLSAGARRGLLMKGGTVIETVGKLDVIAFDKTGTLTEGKPKVTDVIGLSRSDKETLRLAAALDAGSSHPVAVAVLRRATVDGVPIVGAEAGRAIGGKGVTGKVAGEELFLGSLTAAAELATLGAEVRARVDALQASGKTVSVLLAGAEVIGLLAVRDEPRDDAREGLAVLTAMGIRTIMLSGDNVRTAEAIGRDLGIEPRGGLLPEDKLRIVNELKAAGAKVGKVGDGINDAPALAAADIGIAMGGGTDVALETADAAVLNGKVGDIATMIDLSRRTMANIWQNIVVALGLKAVFLVTTVLGITGLWPAILADTGATVLVTLNALRLLGQAGSKNP